MPVDRDLAHEGLRYHAAAPSSYGFGDDGYERGRLRSDLASKSVAEGAAHAGGTAAVWLRKNRERCVKRFPSKPAGGWMEHGGLTVVGNGRHGQRLAARRAPPILIPPSTEFVIRPLLKPLQIRR